MNVTLTNIAKVRHANLVCQGLTAIIGDNNMGKSTIGKVLYSFFHTFSNLQKGFFDARAGYVLESLNLRNIDRTRRFFLPEWFSPGAVIDDEELERRFDLYIDRRISLRNFSLTVGPLALPRDFKRELIADIKEQIRKVSHISEKLLLRDSIQADLNRYFNNQFLPNYSQFKGESEISLTIKGRKIVAKWNTHDQPMTVEDSLRNDAWFIGTPLVMDALGTSVRMPSWGLDSISKELISRLRLARPQSSIARRVADTELSTIYEIMDECLPGDFVVNTDGALEVVLTGMKTPLNAGNLSMGIKAFALLRLMIDFNLLKRKDVLILDEPENHLHPEFQVLFADVIVELQKTYDLTVLVTTHSPYFLQALELSSRMKKAEKVEGTDLKVYQPKFVDDLKRVEFDDISNNTSSMYRKFAKIMRELEIERMKVESLEKSITDEGGQG